MSLLEDLQEKLRHQIIFAFSAIIGMIGLGTIAYTYLEDWTVAQAFYFSVVTLTTVGYGDLHPTTDASRVFTAAYILVGVGIMLASLGTIASSYLKMTERQSMLTHERRLKRRADRLHEAQKEIIDNPDEWPHEPE